MKKKTSYRKKEKYKARREENKEKLEKYRNIQRRKCINSQTGSWTKRR